MSARASRWWLFALALVTLPIPMLVVTGELAPALRYLQIAGWMSAVVWLEGASVTLQQLLAVFWVHAILGIVLCWLLAWLVARVLRGVSPRARAVVVLVLAAVALAVALAGPVYRTPLGPEPRANLVGALS